MECKSYVKTDASIDNIGNSNVIEKLYRKYKFYRLAIEIMLLEISQLEQSEVTLIAMKSSLLQVYEKEEQCGLIVQEIISLHKDESIVDQEIRDWTELQQRILRVSTRAEGYIAQMIRNEEVKLRSVEHKTVLNEIRGSNLSNNLKLPRFTLPEFCGNIIEWVSWWDQFKSCILENDTLS